MGNYANLIVHSTPLAFGNRATTFAWSGSAHLPVEITPHHLEQLGMNGPMWPVRLQIDGYPLKLVPDSQYRFHSALYVRIDGLNWLSWIRWTVYRKARALSVETYYRIIITLHVWGLASYEPNRRPSWRDIGKK